MMIGGIWCFFKLVGTEGLVPRCGISARSARWAAPSPSCQARLRRTLGFSSLPRILFPAVRTPMMIGGIWCFFKLVGTEGFEPPTSCSQSRRSTRLSYVPSDRAERGVGPTAPVNCRLTGNLRYYGDSKEISASPVISAGAAAWAAARIRVTRWAQFEPGVTASTWVARASSSDMLPDSFAKADKW